MWHVHHRRTTPLAIAIAAMAACSDSSGPEDPGNPPTLPSVASMQADLTFFETQAAIISEQVTNPGTHFVAGALGVTVARFWTGVTMAVPVATWAAAASDSPEFQDGAWHWDYSVSENGQTFAANLTGAVEGSESVWEMRITASALNPPLDDYLWYTGRATLTGAEGEWHIFNASLPSTRTEVLAIDWTHPSASAWTLSFTNVLTGSAEFGDELSYEVNGDLRTVRFTDASAQTTAEVGWNHSTNAGYVLAPGYNSGLKSCWDTAFQNVACP
ncbi:MAG TPA: hypothetical protein VF981_12375 [Gemmatimonadaceae bacterium]